MEGHNKYFLPVVDAHIAGVDLDVVVGGDGDDLHLLVARRGEVLVLDPQPLHPRPVQLPRDENKYYLTPMRNKSIPHLKRHMTLVFFPAPGGPYTSR